MTQLDAYSKSVHENIQDQCKGEGQEWKLRNSFKQGVSSLNVASAVVKLPLISNLASSCPTVCSAVLPEITAITGSCELTRSLLRL